MKGAIIGFGKIALGHLSGYQKYEKLTVTSVVDISPQRRTLAKEHFGLRAYSSFEQLVESEQLDFIDICTPPDTHAIYSAKSLNNGFHTICEKPVFLPDSSGYQNQLSIIASSDKLFYPGHVYKFSPVLAEVEEIIREGALGKILRADFKTLRVGHALGTKEWNPDWRRNLSISKGGILRDHGPHSIYTAMHLTNSIPLAVSCIAGRFHDKFPQTEDTAFVRMKCTNDVEVNFTLSWSSHYRNTCYSVTGTRGSIMVEDDNLIVASDGKVTQKTLDAGFNDPSHKSWFRDMFADFTARIKDPSHHSDLITESLITSVVMDAAYDSSAQSGEWRDIVIPNYSKKHQDHESLVEA